MNLYSLFINICLICSTPDKRPRGLELVDIKKGIPDRGAEAFDLELRECVSAQQITKLNSFLKSHLIYVIH